MLQWWRISLLRYITLAFERLGISDDFCSMFGKYFRSQRNTKYVKNSYAKTAGFPVCLLGIFMLWLTQHARSVTSQISWEHSKFHGLYTIFSSILFWSKRITIFARLSLLWQPWKKCRFFEFSRNFHWIHEKFWRICNKIEC